MRNTSQCYVVSMTPRLTVTSVINMSLNLHTSDTLNIINAVKVEFVAELLH